MVTHNATVLEQRLLTGESPPPAASIVAASTSTTTAVPREDPMSHRIIEKRRRDRMNNCLADLSRLIPAEYLKKGRGRIEKTEIIEMAIRHMKHLQSHACRHGDQCNGGGGASGGGSGGGGGAGAGAAAGAGGDLSQQPSPEEPPDQPPSGGGGGGGTGGPIVLEHYRLGYQECLSEAMHFLVEVEGFFAGDPLCVQLINHLQRHCDRILKGDRLNYPRTHLGETTSSSGSSCGSGRGRATTTAGGVTGGGGGGGGCNSSGGLGSSGLGSASASGSSPGSCSDSGRLEPPPQPPREIGPGRRGGGAATLASLATLGRHEEMQANGGAGCYDEPPVPGQQLPLGSQLRDMLTGAQTQDRRCLGEVLTCSMGSNSMQSRQMGGVGSTPPASSVIHGTAPPASHPPPQLKHHQHHHNPHHAPPPPMAHSLMQPYAAASPGPVPSDGTPVSLYKFKNNIKQRFSAEHVHGGTETAGAAAVAAYAKRRRFACESDDALCGAGSGGLLSLSVRRRDSETCSVPSPPASPPPPPGAYGPGLPLLGGPGSARSPSPASSPAPNNFSQAPGGPAPPRQTYPGSHSRPVPVFALHSRGAYYMPLTLDSDVLAPYVDCACEGGATAADAGPAPVALHPVTISVNFTRAPFVCPRVAVARQVSTWKTDSGTPWKTEPGTFGAPRWPECAPDRG